MIKKILGVALALSVVFGITYAANDGRMKDRTFEEVRHHLDKFVVRHP